MVLAGVVVVVAGAVAVVVVVGRVGTTNDEVVNPPSIHLVTCMPTKQPFCLPTWTASILAC